ncbi:hypothetical protein BC827DRAFT_842208 [Russula dissimulans]|nr:hypothetical protein BC827DRAFT_842208 [Russula dissimulans]
MPVLPVTLHSLPSGESCLFVADPGGRVTHIWCHIHQIGVAPGYVAATPLPSWRVTCGTQFGSLGPMVSQLPRARNASVWCVETCKSSDTFNQHGSPPTGQLVPGVQLQSNCLFACRMSTESMIFNSRMSIVIATDVKSVKAVCSHVLASSHLTWLPITGQERNSDVQNFPI